MADLAFFGAKILDGTGGPWFYGNLLVSGERISRIEATGAPQKPRPGAASQVMLFARMKTLVRQAMEDGAVGLSSGLIYPPNSYASTEELIELARVASSYGGIYLSHIRNEADEIVDALNEAIRIGREAQLPVHILHLKVAGKKNFGRTAEVGRIIEKARAEGVDVTANRYPVAQHRLGRGGCGARGSAGDRQASSPFLWKLPACAGQVRA